MKKLVLGCVALALAMSPFPARGAAKSPSNVRLPGGYFMQSVSTGLDFPTAIAFLTWAFALRYTDAGKQSLTTFLVPAIAALLAWVLLDEVPPALAFAGGALCIVGVLVTRRKPRSSPAILK